MTITFVIPTYNASEYLEQCLQSIRNQTQPADIIVVDGGSTDNTVDIALKYKCEVMYNPLKLAEFGLKQGILATKTDLVVVFAADNELGLKNWVKLACWIFDKTNLSAVWGGIKGDDRPINQYFGLIQNDPLCWFMNPPHVWGANGLIYRTKDIKPIFNKPGYIGDNDAFQTMVEQNKKIRFANEVEVIHHHCKNIRHCVSKWWRNHTQHYLAHKAERNMRWIIDKWFYPKLLLWMVYVPLLAFPHSIYMAIRDRNKAWLYHYPLSMCQLSIYLLAKLGVR